VPPGAVEAFLEGLPADLVAVLDEAYYEYLAPDRRPDALRLVRGGRRILVLRTFSKIYGLAGLRIGYGIGPADLVALLNRLRAPFNTSSLAQAAATAALQDDTHVASTRAVTEAGRKYLTAQCRALGCGVVPSEANFLLVDVGRPGAAVTEALLRQGVIVRPMGGYGFPNHLRISVGTGPENERCIAALRSVLGG